MITNRRVGNCTEDFGCFCSDPNCPYPPRDVLERDFVTVLRLRAWERAGRRIKLQWIERWIMWPAAVVLAAVTLWMVTQW